MSGLALLEHATGEVVQVVDAAALLRAAGITDPATTEPEQLAAFDENAKTLKGITDEARGIVSDELVRRRDLEVSGTLTVGGYKIVVPSRSAGSTRYDTDLTVAALERLVEAGLISENAKAEACPDVTPCASVSWDLLARILRALDGAGDTGSVTALRVELDLLLYARPDATYKPVAAKLDALCKLGGQAADALTACKVDVEPPRRKATITRVSDSRREERS